MIININGLDINYETNGEGSDVLFLHGWGCPSENYTVLTSYIARGGYRITTFDFPGFGKSQMPDKAWNIEDYAGLVKTLIEKLELNNPILIGHSHGGRVIMYMCANGYANPEKVILLGAAGVVMKAKLNKRIKIYVFKTIKKVLSVKLWAKASEPLLNKARNYFGSADYNAAPPILRQTLVNVVNYDITPILENIKASTLLIYGENDTATPVAAAKIIESKIPDAGLCVIKEADHFAFVQKPYEVNSIIGAFLNIN